MTRLRLAVLAAALVAATALVEGRQQTQPSAGQDAQAFRFRTGVDLVNVTATVTDQSGRFVSGLRL